MRHFLRTSIVAVATILFASQSQAANQYISGLTLNPSPSLTDTMPDCALGGCNSTVQTLQVTLQSLSTLFNAHLPAINLASSGSGGVTGLLPNANLANPSMTVNGTTCTLGGSCTPSGSGSALTVGTTTISSGTTYGVLFNNTGNVLGNTGAGTAGQVLTSNGSGSAPTFQNATGGGSLTVTGTSGSVSGATSLQITGAAGTTVAVTGTTPSAIATITAASGGSPAFSSIASGTNTTAAMVVGSGASLAATGSGSINATQLGGATFATPGAIGGTTPAAGAFTTLSASGSLTTNVTGSTQCLHVNTGGVVSGTGSDCGAGSSGALPTSPNGTIAVGGASLSSWTLDTAAGVTNATTSSPATGASPTAAQWDATWTINLNAGSLTATIPASSGLNASGGVVVAANANNGTIAATSPDTITSGAGTTGAGGSVTVAAGCAAIVTKGGGGLLVSGNNCSASGAVSAVANSDGTLTISPTTGSVTASLALGHANTWTGAQTFGPVEGAVNVQSGTPYSFVASDCGKTVLGTDASAATYTIPASIVPATGTACVINVVQGAAGKISVNGSAVTPATLVSAHSYTATEGTAGSAIGLILTTVGATATAYLTGDGS